MGIGRARGIVRSGLIGATATSIVSCTGPLAELRPIPVVETPTLSVCAAAEAERCTGEVTFTYLGVGGFIIRAGDDAVMTAPSFTHPGIVWAATPIFPHISSKHEIVDRELRRLLGDSMEADLARVRSVLVGHSHYDHAMDVPYVMQRYVPQARLVGGMTTKRILVGDPWISAHRAQIDSIALIDAGTPWRAGEWVPVPGGRMRVMALRSSHAPNFLGITIAPWRASKDYDELPETGWGWRMGDPYAYLIDVLEAGRPVFRILYQDAASRPVDNLLPPLAPDDQRPVDIAIICAGNYDHVESYPDVLVGAVHPRFLIVGHWEDFFRSPDKPSTPIRFTDTWRLHDRLETTISGRWYTPQPGGRIRVRYARP
jgi:hypothetical protein